jgi:hypothetical protein
VKWDENKLVQDKYVFSGYNKVLDCQQLLCRRVVMVGVRSRGKVLQCALDENPRIGGNGSLFLHLFGTQREQPHVS